MIIVRKKVRLVAQDFNQEEYIDYEETLTPVINMIRIHSDAFSV